MVGVMIQTALLVSAIGIIQKALGDRLHVYVRYGLWLLVAVRLLLPVNFIDSSFSILHMVETAAGYGQESSNNVEISGGWQVSDTAKQPENMQAHDSEEEMTLEDGLWKTEGDAGAGYESKGIQVEQDAQTEEVQQTGSRVIDNDTRQTAGGDRADGTWTVAKWIKKQPVKTVMYAMWIAGSLAVGGFFGVSYVSFRRRLCRARTAYQGTYAGVMGRRRLPVYLVKGLPSPCLAGLFRPAIYIGKEMDTASDTFRYAVAHEEVHYLHRDNIWAFIRAILVIIYWFHPFVWIAASASARDGELACDYGTIQRIGRKERFAYSEMLLKLSAAKKGKRVYSYGTMLRPDKSELEERIRRLTGTKKSSAWAGVLTGALMICLAGCAFTGAGKESGENKESAVPADMTAEAVTDEDNEKLADEENGKPYDGETTGRGNGVDETDDSHSDAVIEPVQIEAVPADISKGTVLGADGPTLDFAGHMGSGQESIVIFHDYSGLVVYDLTNRRIVRSLDLAPIGCQMTQGDDACETAVSADGLTVWLHPRSKRYLYRYEIEENLLWQEPLVKNFQIDLEGEVLFDRYLVTEGAQSQTNWQSNYLYEEYQDERGSHSAYIYLYIPDGKALELGNLQCVWSDMVFLLWDEIDDEAPDSQTVSGQTMDTGQIEQEMQIDGFPYSYQGNVEDIGIIYDKPCKYSRISDTFGSRTHPVTQEVIVHEGIDYAAERGTDVTAAADGIVYATGYSTKYGNYVVLLHINGEMTYYCHCAEVVVEKDTQVRRGEKIATVGSTGMSTGAHLHFALSRFGEFINPEEAMHDVIPLE